MSLTREYVDIVAAVAYVLMNLLWALLYKKRPTLIGAFLTAIGPALVLLLVFNIALFGGLTRTIAEIFIFASTGTLWITWKEIRRPSFEQSAEMTIPPDKKNRTQ